LWRSDLRLRPVRCTVVPPENSINDARVKQCKSRVVRSRGAMFDLYAEYMAVEHGSLNYDFSEPCSDPNPRVRA
jgi:hypothetical protein